MFTLRKIYGALGFNVGLIGTILICTSAQTIYFNVCATNLYPLIWLILSTFTDIKYIDDYTPYQHFDTFSLAWVCIIMYALLVTVSLKKDLTVFMKMGSVGTCCVCILIVYVIYQFISSIF